MRACTNLGVPLIVGGEGRDRAALEDIAGPTIRFVGRVGDDELGDLLAHCRAFIFPGYEDFGITPVEAQAAGRPVIAYAAGGALDTVIDGETGIFFREQTSESLADAIRRLDSIGFDPIAIRQNAERFSVARFKRELGAFIEEKWRELVKS